MILHSAVSVSHAFPSTDKFKAYQLQLTFRSGQSAFFLLLSLLNRRLKKLPYMQIAPLRLTIASKERRSVAYTNTIRDVFLQLSYRLQSFPSRVSPKFFKLKVRINSWRWWQDTSASWREYASFWTEWPDFPGLLDLQSLFFYLLNLNFSTTFFYYYKPMLAIEFEWTFNFISTFGFSSHRPEFLSKFQN